LSSPPTTSLAEKNSFASSTLTCFFAVWLSAAPILWNCCEALSNQSLRGRGASRRDHDPAQGDAIGATGDGARTARAIIRGAKRCLRRWRPSRAVRAARRRARAGLYLFAEAPDFAALRCTAAMSHLLRAAIARADRYGLWAS
jgi:hypothetical protein